MTREGDIDGYLLKPMNCPMHIKIYSSEKHSLPRPADPPRRVRHGVPLGAVGRARGMTRVRGFTQDDAHLFVTEEQLEAELHGCLDLVRIVFNTLGMSDYRVRVGLRDPDGTKYVGAPSGGIMPRACCEGGGGAGRAVQRMSRARRRSTGRRSTSSSRDVIGREWQLGTVQVDYNLPERFELEYTGADNQPHRPVMIHRAPFGSMERFIGVLIEHFNGAFPLWLSPEQVRVLPISDKFTDYARRRCRAPFPRPASA